MINIGDSNFNRNTATSTQPQSTKPQFWKQDDDNFISPSHYKVGGIETIDYMQAKMTSEQYEGYLLGNIIKYTSRYRHKNGVEDLRKAQWYLNKLIGVSNDSSSR